MLSEREQLQSQLREVAKQEVVEEQRGKLAEKCTENEAKKEAQHAKSYAVEAESKAVLEAADKD